MDNNSAGLLGMIASWLFVFLFKITWMDNQLLNALTIGCVTALGAVLGTEAGKVLIRRIKNFFSKKPYE